MKSLATKKEQTLRHWFQRKHIGNHCYMFLTHNMYTKYGFLFSCSLLFLPMNMYIHVICPFILGLVGPYTILGPHTFFPIDQLLHKDVRRNLL